MSLLTCIKSISSDTAKVAMTAFVTPSINSTSKGPPLDLIKLFPSWIAEEGICNVSSVVVSLINPPNFGDKTLTTIEAMEGFEHKFSTVSSIIAVDTISEK